MTELSQRRSKLVARLRARKSRMREGRVLVEGVRAVGEALDAGAEVDFAVVAPRLGLSEEGGRIRARLGEVDVVEVSDSELDALSDTDHPQGVILVCLEPRLGLDALAQGSRWLVLDAVQDPGNVGTLVRSAVAFGFDGVVCLDGTVDPWGAKVIRASAGMAFRLPVIVCTVSDMLNAFAERGTPVLVGAADGSSDVAPLRSFALVLGNEGAGVRNQVRSAATETVAVSMRGPSESLNVAVAGSILMHDLTREPS